MAANPYHHIGFNPVPGVPEEVSKLQKKVSEAATALESTHRQLTKLTAESSYWEGDAADAFRENLEGDLTDYLKKAGASLRSAASHLHKWDGQLGSNRELAKKYDEEAGEKKAAADKAKDAYNQTAQNPDLKPAKTYPSQEEADAATARMRAAEREMNEAHAALTKANDAYDDLNRKIKELEANHSDQADVIAKALSTQADKAPDKGFWESVGDIIGSIGKFLADHAGTIGAIAGLLAFIPVLTPIMAPIAMAASAVSMGKNVIFDPKFRSDLMGGGSGMDTFAAWASLAGDAVGMIPGGKALGLAAKEGFEGAADGANMAAKVWEGTKSGLSGIGRSATDEAAEAVRTASNSAKGMGLYMAEVKVNLFNVGANVVSSAETFGAVDDDGTEHNTAEGTKAAATAHGIAGLMGWL